MGSLSRIIKISPEYNHMYPYKKEVEGYLTAQAEVEKAMWLRRQRWLWCRHRPRNAGGPQKLEEAGTHSPLEPPEEARPGQHFNFSAQWYQFWPPEMWDNKILLF